MNTTPLIYVLFDGIENSVFEGQVVAPLLATKRQHPEQEIVMVSFERTPHPRLQALAITKGWQYPLHILKRVPYLGLVSLRPAISQLKNVLRSFSEYSLIARGPLAGWIAGKARDSKKCVSFAIQARGLLAAEYEYAHGSTRNIFKKLLHRLRARQLAYLEQKSYQQKDCSIESVSSSLASYLSTTYHLNTARFTLAEHDIPQLITPRDRERWRAEVRNELAIEASAYVYCYNGSAKPWQCPELAIQYFKNALHENNASFFLVLTQDAQVFLELLSLANIPANRYCVLTVSHEAIYKYLSAADAGIIFRKPSIINWVSRPTKILEYQAVGLSIIHNNTIGLLSRADQFPMS